ncbi:MAG: hypothetical protein RSC68_00420 [Acinetobacter sp.]
MKRLLSACMACIMTITCCAPIVYAEGAPQIVGGTQVTVGEAVKPSADETMPNAKEPLAPPTAKNPPPSGAKVTDKDAPNETSENYSKVQPRKEIIRETGRVTSLEPDEPTVKIPDPRNEIPPCPVSTLAIANLAIPTAELELNPSKELSAWLHGYYPKKSDTYDFKIELWSATDGTKTPVESGTGTFTSSATGDFTVSCKYPTKEDYYAGAVTFTLDKKDVVINIRSFNCSKDLLNTKITDEASYIAALTGTVAADYTLMNDIVITKPIILNASTSSTITALGYSEGMYSPERKITFKVPSAEEYAIKGKNYLTHKGITFEVNGITPSKSLIQYGYGFRACKFKVSNLATGSMRSIIENLTSSLEMSEVNVQGEHINFYAIEDIAQYSSVKQNTYRIDASGEGLGFVSSNNGVVENLQIFPKINCDGNVHLACRNNNGTLSGVQVLGGTATRAEGSTSYFDVVNNSQYTMESMVIVMDTSLMPEGLYNGPLEGNNPSSSMYGAALNLCDVTNTLKKNVKGTVGNGSYVHGVSPSPIPDGIVQLNTEFNINAPRIGAIAGTASFVSAQLLPVYEVTVTPTAATFKLTTPAVGSMMFEMDYTFKGVTVPITVPFKWKTDIVYATEIHVTSPLELITHDSSVIAYTLTPAESKEIPTYTAADPTIVTVDTNGKVTALKSGKTSIELKTVNASATLKVEVTASQSELWVIALHKIVPPIKYADGTKLQTLRAQLTAFSPKELTEVGDVNIQLLEKYEDDFSKIDSPEVEAAKAWAAKFKASVDALPSVKELKLTDEPAVVACRAELSAASPFNRSYLDVAVVPRLEGIEARITELKGQQTEEKEITDLITKLPEPANIRLADAASILAIDAKIAAAHVPYLNVDMLKKLKECKLELSMWEAAKKEYDTVMLEIQRLPSIASLTLADKFAVDTVVKHIQALSTRAVTLMDAAVMKNIAEYTTRIAELQLQEYVQKAQVVIDLIKALPVSDFTDRDLKNIKAARAAYDALDANIKLYVTNYQQLVKIETDYAVYIVQYYQKLATKVEQLIRRLPAIPEVTLEDKTKITEAQTQFDNLQPEVQAYVRNRDVLAAVMAEYQYLLDHEQEAKQFTAKVEAIGTNELKTSQWKEVLALYKQFTEFTEYTRRCIPLVTKTKIVELNNKIASLLNNTAREMQNGFIVSGPLGMKPKLSVTCLTFAPGSDLYLHWKPTIENNSHKTLISLYTLELKEDEKVVQPFDTMRVLFPLQDIYSTYGDIGIVEVDSAGQLRYIKPNLVDISGKRYYEIYTKDITLIGVVANPKAFGWIFSFFGQHNLVPVVGKMLDNSYTKVEKPTKVNPNTAGTGEQYA